MRSVSLVGLICGIWLAESDMAWAAKAPKAPDPGSYVFPYFVVIVAIGLGLAVACNPSRRRVNAKPEEYTRKKLV
jgi:hypothetical protein